MIHWLKKKKVFLALHVITLNRKDLLEFLIKESSEFFDVIRVCDGGSTDGTQEMVKRYGCELYERDWDDKYHEQDNYLLKKAKNKDQRKRKVKCPAGVELLQSLSLF